MAGPLGRVQVGGQDRGAAFALGPRLVVTANHVVRACKDKPVVYVPIGSEAIDVERVQHDIPHDAAILWLADDVEKSLPTAMAVPGARWRVESPPPGTNDPELTGTVTALRMTIHKAKGQRVEAVQLEVNQQLGDYGGYSGSAVLDSLGRVALALLVEQKPLRTPVTLGEKQAASNVLYAVPIGDVITAFDLPVRPAKPIRFDVGLLPPGMVTRPDLLDEAVRRVIGTRGGDSGAGLILLRGPGGVGKTVLARQVADDVRVWAGYTDGIIMLRAGQTATADGVARKLQEALRYRERDLADMLAGQRLLLIVDDVWNGQLLGTLRANLPATITILATTRGVSVPGALAVKVGAVGRGQAIQILSRETPRSEVLDRALGDLAEALFGWALLLTLAAAELHRDDELSWGFGDDYDSHPEVTQQSVLIGRAETLKTEFPDAPTMLDDLESTPEGAAPRSVDVLVRRSLEWLGPDYQTRFELLAIYPAGAEITQAMLEDLWETSPNVTRKVISLLVGAGLAQPVRRDPLTVELHDLITAWLHHECGAPGGARHQPVHLRVAGLCLLPDGSPGPLTKDRAEWLAYHLVTVGAWDRLMTLSTLKWRAAFLAATGSDAAFLAGLDRYGDAALDQLPEDVYHAVRAWLFAAHVRALIGQLPIPLLVAMAVAGDAVAGITQAGQHPSAGEAIPAVLAAVTDRPGALILIERAVTVAETIPGDQERGRALAGIVEQLAGIAISDSALIDRAMALAESIPDDWQRGEALTGLVGQMAATGNPALIDRALAVARGIPHDWQRGEALAGLVGQMAATGNPALIDRALAVARAVTSERERNRALACLAGQLGATANPGLLDQALTVAGAITSDHDRNETLASIAESMAATGDPALIDRALALAQTIPEEWKRDDTVVGIAGRLAATGDLALIDQALALAQTIPEGWKRNQALTDIAGHLAAAAAQNPTLVDQALALVQTIHSGQERSEALAAIAKQLADIDPSRVRALIEQALTIAGTVTSDWQRSQALAGIAGYLAGAAAGNPALVDHALALADTIPEDRQRSEAVAGIAARLAGIDPTRTMALIDQALTMADAIPDIEDRSWALIGIAKQLASAAAENPKLIDQALALAETITGDEAHTWALACILEQLADAAAGNPKLLERALDMALAGTIPEGQGLGRAQAAIARQLAAAGSPTLLAQALALTGIMHNDWQRSEALAGIAGRLAGIDPTRTTALIDQALTMAEAIPDDEERTWALTGIAKQLANAAAANPTLILRAIGLAATIPTDEERDEALAAVAQQLANADPDDPTLLKSALATAGAISAEQERNDAVAQIHALKRSGVLYELSRWRLRPLGTTMDLLNVFLKNCDDKVLTEQICLAALDVIRDFPVKT